MPQLPTTNPFQNLFGSENEQPVKTTTLPKRGLPTVNPFEGLFEQPKVEEVKPQIVPTEIAQREEKITTAKPQGVVSKALTKAAEFFGIFPKPGEKAAFTPAQEPKVKEFVYNELKSDPVENNGFLTILKSNFIPTQAILSVDSTYVNEARQKIATEYQQEHPLLSIAPEVIGQLANLVLVGRVGGGFGLAAKTEAAAGGLGRLLPTATRIAGLGAESGSIFGITSAISETLNQIQKRKFEPVKLLKETAKGAATGVALGAAGALPKLVMRVPAAGATLGGISTLEAYLNDGKINAEELRNIGVNTLIGAGFELFGGRTKTKLFKEQEMRSIANEKPIQDIMSRNPALKRTDAERIAGMLDELSYLTKAGIYQNAPKEVLDQFARLPREFWSWTKEAKTNYFNNVTSEVVKGKTIPQAIESANQSANIKTNLIDRFNELKAKVSTPEGQHDVELITEYQEVQKALKAYQEENKEAVMNVKDPVSNEDIAIVNVVKNDNDKWSYSYDVNTKNNAVSVDFATSEQFNSRDEAVRQARQEIINWVGKEIETATGEELSQLQTINYQTKELKETREIAQELKNNLNFYQSIGGFTAGTEKANAALLGIEKLLKTDEGKKIAKSSVDKGIADNEIKTDAKAEVKLYRAGEVSEINNLASATLDKNVAKRFQDEAKAQGRDIVVYEFKTKAENISFYIGGAEKEVLLPKNIVQGALTPTEAKAPEISGKERFAAEQEIVKLEQELGKEYAKLGEKAQEKIAEIWVEIVEAEAGQRLAIRDETGAIVDWIGVKSSFPQWIPEAYRNKKDLNKMLEGLSDITKPKYPSGNKSAQRDLYNIILDELDRRLEINTSEIRKSISQNYGQIYQKKGEGISYRGVERGEGRERGEGEEINVEELFAAVEKVSVAQLDKRVVDLTIKKYGKETSENLERIEQKAEEYDPVFLKEHPEIKGHDITVYHDPIAGEDWAVVDNETNKIVEIFDKELSQAIKGVKEVKPEIKPRVEEAAIESNEDFYRKMSLSELQDRLDLLESAGYKKGSMADEAAQIVKKLIAEKESAEQPKPRFAKPKVSEEFKVGDVIDTQGHSNMVSPVKIREIVGNTLKFTDAEGTDFAGMARATVRTLVNEGSWKRITELAETEEMPRFAKKEETRQVKLLVDEKAFSELQKALKKDKDMAAIARAEGYNLDWSSLEIDEQAAIKEWVKLDKEGLPPEFTDPEMVAELRLPGIPTRMRPQVYKEEIKKPAIERDMPNRDFETYLNVKINPEIAFSKLVEIANNLGVKIKIAEIGMADGKFSVSKDGSVMRGVAIKDIRDYFALSHEVGHVVDFVLIGNKKYLPSLAERIGQSPISKTEKMLKEELKDISDYVRPFDRRGVKRAYLLYRNRRRELLADFMTLYLTDPDKAKIFAPYFTSGIEAKYPKLQEIRDIFLVPPEETTPYDLPLPKVKNIIGNLLLSWGKVAPEAEVKLYKEQYGKLKTMKERMGNLVGAPFWKGMKHPKFAKIYRAIQDNAIYKLNGAEAKMLKTLEIKDLEDLPEVSKNRITKAIYTGNDKGVQSYFTDEELVSGFGMTEDEIDAYQRIVATIKKGTNYLIEARKLRYGFYELTPERQKEIEPVIAAQVDKLGGYFPLDRFGEIAIFGKFVEAGTNKETPFFSLRDDKNEAIRLANQLNQMGYKDIAVYPVKRLPSEFYQNIRKFSFSDLENIAEAAGVDNETPEIKSIKNYLAKAAWDKHFIERKYVPGYERTYENMLKTITSFITSSTRRWGKAKAYYEANKGLKEIDPYKEPESYAYASNYIKDFFDANPAEFQTIREFIYLYYLAFKTSFLVQNLTQPLVTTLPEIANYVGGIKAPVVFTKGIYNSLAFLKSTLRGETPAIDGQLSKLLTRGFEERVISGMFTEQILGITHPAKEKISNAIGIFGIASETANRTLTASTGYIIAKDYLKMTDEEEIYKFMVRMVEKTQFPYGSQNLPRVIAGAGKMKGLVKTIAVFKMYQLNYLHFLSQRIVQGTLGAKAWGFGMLMLLAGIMGLPFMSVLNWIIKKAFGRDIRAEIRGVFGEGKQELADVVLYGAPTLGGVNASFLVGLGDIISPERDPTNQIFGAGYGIYNRMKKGVDLITQGKTQEGLSYIAPPTLGNIIMAQEWADEGKKFKDKVYYKPSGWDITQKVLSFTPNKLSKQYEAKEIEANLYDKYTNIRSRFIEEIKGGKNYQETKKKFEKEIEDHNKKVDEYLFVMYEALGLDVSRKEYKSILKKYQIEKSSLPEWRDEAKKQLKEAK